MRFIYGLSNSSLPPEHNFGKYYYCYVSFQYVLQEKYIQIKIFFPNWMNKFEKLDIFGVPICLLTNSNNEKYQSKIGAVSTLILSSVSLMYFLYIFVLWNTNQIAPTISSQQKTLGYAEFQLQEPIIELQLQDFTGDIDPFQKENNIITPLLFKFLNTTIQEEPTHLFSTQEKPYTISINNLSLVLNTLVEYDEKQQQQTQYSIVFARCSESLQIDDSYCADENTIDEYLSKFHGFLFITIYLSKLNSVTTELEQFKKQYYTSFDTNKPLYSQITLKQQETIIDNGILFNNYKHHKFLNNYELISQETDRQFTKKVINSMSNFSYTFDSYGSYLFRIDNISIVEEISYPKLGQILAQIGSVIQLLFLLKHIVIYYNNLLLENKLLNDIIKMYYPEFKDFRINFLNKLQFSLENNVHLKQPIENIQQIHSTLQQGARQKCRLINILYEISRIQFILQDKFGDQILSQSHEMGAKLSNKQINVVYQKESHRLYIKPVDSLNDENQSLFIEPLEMLIKQY
ncbi:unnamed protein product [Paramecium sonneborni]|uniref:Transmembrane protein n=1 Tax=Paramecium sonneborni TaxID=65129 RepID=A0A8S1MEI3_9CILI|nr:unnamed protein product [Paramecium sonneborni]